MALNKQENFRHVSMMSQWYKGHVQALASEIKEMRRAEDAGAPESFKTTLTILHGEALAKILSPYVAQDFNADPESDEYKGNPDGKPTEADAKDPVE